MAAPATMEREASITGSIRFIDRCRWAPGRGESRLRSRCPHSFDKIERMAVLIEAISVVVRREAILRALDSWEAFKALATNRTLCADSEVCRMGFMDPRDVERFIQVAETRDLVLQGDGRAIDIVVVDQLRGPTTRCDWVEFGHVPHESGTGRIACCRLNGSTLTHVAMPDGWVYEESLSSSYGFVPSEHVE